MKDKLTVLEGLLKDSKNEAIHKAFDDVSNQYKKAVNEFTSMYNVLDKQIKLLEGKNIALQIKNKDLKEELNKWDTHKRKCKKFNPKLLAQEDNVLHWKNSGMFNTEIAKELKKKKYGKITISEGGIRHFLKTFAQS